MAEKVTDELQLVDNILKGDRHLFRKIVDRYSPIVFHVVRGFVDREDEAEELAQQIFVKTYEKLESFNRQSKFSTWLYMIAKNHCRDYAKNIRRKNKRFDDVDRVEFESEFTDKETADQQLENKEQGVLLNMALKKISEEYAEAFLMKYRDDMTYRAMAKRLNVTVSALKVRVHRARKELKEIIDSNR